MTTEAHLVTLRGMHARAMGAQRAALGQALAALEPRKAPETRQRVCVTVSLPDGTVLDAYPHVQVEARPDRPIWMADDAILSVADNLRRLGADRPDRA